MHIRQNAQADHVTDVIFQHTEQNIQNISIWMS